MQADNGVPAEQLGVKWPKSSASNPSGSCVEIAALADGAVAIRNSGIPLGRRRSICEPRSPHF